LGVEKTREVGIDGARSVFLAHFLDCLRDGIDFNFIFLSVFPSIGVAFVDLDGIDMTLTSIDDLKTGVCLYFQKDCLDENVLVGEWNWTGGQFGHPSGHHIWLKRILLFQNTPPFVMFVETDQFQLFLTLLR
jgi:hypothetical protein